MKKMGIAVLSALVAAAAAFPQQALYDVVIHDGMIVDGTGNPWYRADIGITGGRIQKAIRGIGRTSELQAVEFKRSGRFRLPRGGRRSTRPAEPSRRALSTSTRIQTSRFWWTVPRKALFVRV